MRAAALGLAVGALATVYIRGWIAGMLYQVHALDWAVIGASLIAILLAMLLAVWWPARRASRVDPQTALRHD